jgi:hypothetical protein
MKSFKLMMAAMVWMVAAVVGVNTVWAAGGNWSPLPVSEMAAKGATHVYTIKYSDLAASTSTNTAVIYTNVAVKAKQGVECVAEMLVTAFDTGNTNFTGSTLLKVGDSTDDDMYLTSTELASDGTEVFLKRGVREAQTLTLTTASVAATNGTFACVTNVTIAAVAGQKVYTSDAKLYFTLTPNAEEALSANTSGEVRVYFRIFDAR